MQKHKGHRIQNDRNHECVLLLAQVASTTNPRRIHISSAFPTSSTIVAKSSSNDLAKAIIEL